MSPRRAFWLPLAALLALAAGGPARAQGIIVDRRHAWPVARSYEVREVALDARVRDQVADVRVSQTFHNPGSVPIDAEFLFPLPEDGAVQSFVLLVDGQELPGRLLPKDEARKVYEEIVRTRRDPALLEYMGRGLFRTSVFPIPPGADRKVTMRYTQLVKRDRDVVEFSYPFSTQKFTAKPIQKLSLNLRLESRDAIKSVYCPSDDARVERNGDHEARVELVRRDVTPSADFRLVVTLAEGKFGASVLSTRPSGSEDGYLLLLASPEVRKPDVTPAAKTVVFVLDRSGSMAGKKMEQARNALRFVLNNLRDGDTFNVVAYDDRVESFRPELQRYGESTRAEALRFVDNLREGGSTNIDAALRAALEMVRDTSRPAYVLFLTDGLPTAGETRESAIADHVKAENRGHARVFSFGVGFDVNARLLDRLSGGHGGTSEYVKPDEDIEAHVSRFYSRLTSPVLTDIRLEWDGTDVNRIYPRDVPDLFEGGQLVLAGRYTRGGRASVTVSGRVGGERQSFRFPVELAERGEGGRHDYVETLWATRRVGDLIDQIDLHGRNKELVDELVALATRYGLLTPYTSFLADENRPMFSAARDAEDARESLRLLDRVDGALGVAQRSVKQQMKAADRPQLAEAEVARKAIGDVAASAPAAPIGGGAGSGYGGYGGTVAGRSNFSLRAAGPATAPASKPGEPAGVSTASVKQVGTKTFYRKAGGWFDSSLKPGDAEKAKVIRQFSDDFFKLARTQRPEFNQYLAFLEPVTVVLDDGVYRIEPEPK